jgi:hypothetical protein
MSTRLGRACGIVLLGLQAVLWGGGQILEARPAAEALSAVAHVESTGNATCPPLHRHVDCLVCRAFGSGATGGAPPAVPVADDASPGTAGTGGFWSASAGFGGGVGARAPPACGTSPTPA